jgi:hypothetical protein
LGLRRLARRGAAWLGFDRTGKLRLGSAADTFSDNENATLNPRKAWSQWPGFSRLVAPWQMGLNE